MCYFKSSPAANDDPNWQTYFKSPGTPAFGARSAGPLPWHASGHVWHASPAPAPSPSPAPAPAPEPAPQPHRGGHRGGHHGARGGHRGGHRGRARGHLGAVPSQPAMTPLLKFLTELRLEEYHGTAPPAAQRLSLPLTARCAARLVELGAVDPVDLKDMRAEDFESVDMKKLEVNRLTAAAQKL